MPSEETMLQAAEACARLARHLERTLAEVDLTLPQFRLLMHLEKTTEVASELARKSQVKPPSLTALVDGLANRSLVERRPDEADKRRVNLHITQQGLAALAEGRRAAAERLAQVAADTTTGCDTEDMLNSLALWIEPLNRWRDAHAR